ncbi:MAG: NTP transferase domain-containing protein [Acidimicrobiales bacterium]|nr:NTP transferase domain-containing protein [Acidimicrobiales bacterium]MYB80256.1 NTP transferase domain-containing protein [Acidimicrobiales bacterium]
MGRSWALVLAAGAGTRFGVVPDGHSKVMASVAGRSMVAWSVEAARGACDGVTLVVPVQMVDELVDSALGVDVVVAGGGTRSASVRAGLGTVPDDVDVVVCHDAARPGASAGLFAGVIAAVRGGADAAVPVLPVSDTLKRVPEWDDSGGVVAGTVDRSGVFAVQTPQAFRREVLVEAHVGEPEATDDAALVEAAGGTVMAIPGEAAAHKVTTAADLVVVEALLGGGAAGGGL